ncbi:MAG TPA: NPCBM/NEW2 domain-containing protein [Microbacterium sp.]|nr:NPCBM/NEW2 domain-containing protein [Microbacterium sp.]
MKLNRERHRTRGLVAGGIASVLVLSGALGGVASAATAAPLETGLTTHTATPITPKPVTPVVPVDTAGATLGSITDVSQDGAAVTLAAERGALRITFLEGGTFRVEADPTGAFTDPANMPQNDPTRTANIVVGADTFTAPDVDVIDGAEVRISSGDVTITVDRETSLARATDADGRVIFEESSPLSFGSNSTTQHLAPVEGEQFLGGGMQNGRSIHTGAVINIASNFDWDDDGYPNAVPYYMSSNGYGALRNTFASGSYDFANHTTTHKERRFDAYYFVGEFKQSLESYTQLTGRPMMPASYALEYGDADCYNRSNPTYQGSDHPDKMTTSQALETAKGFVENDMPGGWMLVNDGYGCEYVDLPETVAAIEEQTGLKTGLWTQRSLTEQEYEVGEAGIRLRKLDVAWVGTGYRMALTGCEAAHSGIEKYSDARGTSLMVEGWAGSQRCGMQWTGDHTGNLDAVRWQVSALTGAGNSGLAFTTGDVDGIFGGSAKSYVRDLQWKAFAPALYSMSGWAPTDKRPWLYGDEATAINRSYLQLRQRLMPYIYTLAAESHRTGVPMMRSIALEYPGDPGSYSAEANNEFLLGEDYLVAPVFSDSDVRNGIYLPAGETWVDFWSGELHEGGKVLNGYSAPLEKLPLFVRAGAVVPQGIVARNSALTPEDSPITLSVYPQGKSTFTLYEDDEVTRSYADGESSRQEFAVKAPQAAHSGNVEITIGKREGDYDGKAAARSYRLEVHTGSAPTSVKLGNVTLAQVHDSGALEGGSWFFDSDTGIVHVDTGEIESGDSADVLLMKTTGVGGKDAEAQAASVGVHPEQRVFQGERTAVTATFTNEGQHEKSDVTLAPVVPEGWTLVSSSGDHADTVRKGASLSAEFMFDVTDAAKAGPQLITVNGSYSAGKGAEYAKQGANQIYVAFGSLTAAYNSVSVTDRTTAKNGDFDGSGNTFSAEAVAAAGVQPGGTVTVGTGPAAIVYDWPEGVGIANALAPAGQTIALDGRGTHLAVLGSAAAGNGATASLKVEYTDGTVATQPLFFPNWLPQPSGLGGAQVAVRSLGRNSASNPAVYEYPTYSYQVYSNLVRLNPDKEVASIVLPTEPRMRIFDWKVVTQPLPPKPQGTVFVSDLTWISATNGWGVIGKDVANKDSVSAPGVPLRINYADPATGQVPEYRKGLGVHAQSKITYYTGDACTSFTAQVGLESGFSGNIVFKIDVDGVNKYQSRTFTPGFAPESVKVDLSGAQYVDLIVEAPGSINGAHGVWGDALLTCG